jgi:hypothetical protein
MRLLTCVENVEVKLECMGLRTRRLKKKPSAVLAARSFRVAEVQATARTAITKT